MDTESEASSSSLVGHAVQGTSYLVLVQTSSRVLTFALNVCLTRYLQDPASFGVASVRLFLLYTSVLTLAREGTRRACMRLDVRSELDSVVRLAWMSTIVGAALTPVFCALFMAMPDEHALQHVPVTDYRTSIVLVGISLLLELLCEPMFVVAQGQLRYRARALIEASAVLWRCITTLLLVLFADMRLLAFAYGHVAYGAALLLSYTILFIRQSRACSKRPSAKHHVDKQSADVANSQHCVQSMRELVPTTLRFPASDATIADIALRASGQTVWKLVLTEGEKMVMVGMGVGADDQGVYALVSNLGSLVARFALQPIEETCLTVFGRLHAQQQQSSSSSSSTTSKSNAAAGRPQLSAEHLLALATKSMILLGLVFVAFGTQFSHMLLHLLYGQRWSMTEAPAALSLYCVYILVIAINGVTEAFVNAVGDANTLIRFNAWLTVCSVIYLASATLLLHWGIRGLIIANCLNMSMRIAFSVHFAVVVHGRNVVKQQRDTPPPSTTKTSSLTTVSDAIAELVPSASVWLAFGLALGANMLSNIHIYDEFASVRHALGHLAVGVVVLVATSLVVVWREAALLRELRAIARGDGGGREKQS